MLSTCVFQALALPGNASSCVLPWVVVGSCQIDGPTGPRWPDVMTWRDRMPSHASLAFLLLGNGLVALGGPSWLRRVKRPLPRIQGFGRAALGSNLNDSSLLLSESDGTAALGPLWQLDCTRNDRNDFEYHSVRAL